jgi:hypothetical protein
MFYACANASADATLKKRRDSMRGMVRRGSVDWWGSGIGSAVQCRWESFVSDVYVALRCLLYMRGRSAGRRVKMRRGSRSGDGDCGMAFICLLVDASPSG